MTATVLLAPPADGPSVEVIDGALRIDRFITTDPDVMALVNTAADAEATVHSALSAGARVLALAQARLDTTVVEQAFGHLHEKMTQLVADSAADVTTGTANVLHHPENGVGATLQNWRAQLEATLAANLRPEPFR